MMILVLWCFMLTLHKRMMLFFILELLILQLLILVMKTIVLLIFLLKIQIINLLKSTNTKYIALKNNEFTKNDYIMVSVTSNTNKLVSVASSFKTFIKSTTPTHNYIQVLYVSPDYTHVVSLDKYTSNITVIHLFGNNGKMELGENKYEFKQDEFLLIETNGIIQDLNIINTEKKDLFIAL